MSDPKVSQAENTQPDADKPEAETKATPEKAAPEETTTTSSSESTGVTLAQRFEQFRESFLPQPHYFEDEEILQNINMAPYRATVPRFLGFVGMLLFVLAVALFLAMWAFGPGLAKNPNWAARQSNYELIALASIIVALILLFKTLQTWLEYHQWQFIVTDKRIIITTPDPEQGFFADAIYLQDNTIKVLDTNFSTSPMWIPFQIISGARDVMLSMGGYEFLEKGAKVKGGIRFPDVSLEDIRRLEALVFGGRKK